MDQDWPSEAVRVLASVMRVIPVGASLSNLFKKSASYFSIAADEVVLTVKTWVKVSPGPMGHCVTPVGPSIEFVPFWKRPWKWTLVVSFPSWLVICTVICSPTLAVIAGTGH